MSCGTCGVQASDTMQGDTGVPAGAPTTAARARCPYCRAFIAGAGAPCHNPRCPGPAGQERGPQQRGQRVGRGVPAAPAAPAVPAGPPPSLDAIAAYGVQKRMLEVALAGGHSVGLLAGGDLTVPRELQAWGAAHGVAVQVVAPCPCGRHGMHWSAGGDPCRCTPAQLRRWRNRPDYQATVSADLLLVTHPPHPGSHITEDPTTAALTEATILHAAAAAATPPARSLPLSEGAWATLRVESRQRGYDILRARRAMRIAQTIARLADMPGVDAGCMMEAVGYLEQADALAYVERLATQGQLPPLQDIPGQEHVKRSLEVALAGGHSVGMVSFGRAGAVNAALLAAWGRQHGVDVRVVASCPCGQRGEAGCTCSPRELVNWEARPAYQQVAAADIWIQVPPTEWEKMEPYLRGEGGGEPEERVLRRAQEQRPPVPATLDGAGESLMRAYARYVGASDVTAPAVQSRVHLAATIARLAHSPTIGAAHLAEAMQYGARPAGQSPSR